MFKSNHTKSKSDTDFHSNKTINDDICGSLKIFHNNISKDLKSAKKTEKNVTNFTRKYSNFKKEEECHFISIFEKILIFKKQLDYYFFRKKLPSIKFDLDITLEIINKKIDDLKNKLIDECPILIKSVLIDKLNEFNEVIKSLIETKPQEFYKEVKFAILSQFERIRLDIFELLENIHENENDENNILQDVNKIKNECKFNHGILFNSLNEFDNVENDNNDNFQLTSELKENIISVLLPIKNNILKFIEEITHDILFSLTKFSYIIDYYSLSISNLNLLLFKSIISYIEINNESNSNSQENKTLFLIELIIILNRTFTKKSLIDIKKRVNASESSIQNSMGKFILNNINELIPKCQGLNNNNKSLNHYYVKSLFTKSYEYYLYYKTYMKSFEDNKKLELVKSFKFYYDLKLIFWKSVYTKMDSNVKSVDICCRICEQTIPLNDFVLHVYYCKEQSQYYKKMNNFKSKIKKYINSLEIYKTKINQPLFNKEKFFFKKNNEMNKIFKKIKKEQELDNIDKNNTNDFLHTLIKIYINENSKPNDYYEKNPEKLSIVSTLIYLTYFVYIVNKKSIFNNNDNNNDNNNNQNNNIENNEDIELSDILGNILSFLIQILLTTEYLLEARHTRTKSNIYLNNAHQSFLSTSNDSFLNPTVRYHSSKNVVFNEFSINNSHELSMNLNVTQERRRRSSVRHQTFCMIMQDIKDKFSFNKALLNQNQNNSIQNHLSQNSLNQSNTNPINMNQNNLNQNIIEMNNDESSISMQSSTSNIVKIDNMNRRDSKSKTIKEAKNFFEMRSNSDNKSNEVFNFFFNQKNKTIKKNLFADNKNKLVNSFNLSKTNRDKGIKRETKSSKFLFQKDSPTTEKGPIKIKQNKDIFNFDKKDSSFEGENILENSLSKEFFSQDKNSFSGSYNNSENDKEKVENMLSKKSLLSAKTSNSNIINEKKVPTSLFLKSEKIILNYKPSFSSFKDGLKQSLFKAQHNEKDEEEKNINNIKVNKTRIKNKISLRSNNSYDNLDSEKKSENDDENKKQKIINKKFEKIKFEEKKRKLSPDTKKKGKKKNSIVDKNKCLVFYDYNETSSENEDNESDSENNSEEYGNLKYSKSKNENNINNLNFFFDLKRKNKENNIGKSKNSSEESDDSYSIPDNDNKGSNKVIVVNAEENEKNEKNENHNQNNSFSGDLSEYHPELENIEEENWFNFDTNFFMNADINVQNINVIDSIKDLLREINNEDEKEKDGFDEHDEHDEENPKITLNLNNNLNKMSDTNVNINSNFKLILPLAKGGYGSVGLYKKTTTGDMFAIKTVNINNMKEKKLSKTLQNERNIMKGVSSDYVVNSYFIFKDEKNYYFVMEYLPGGDVYHLLSSIILPFSTIQLIVAETLLAVYYLHSINIIHHDIKPENILISKDGHFKLSDFGLSKTINEEEKKEDEEEQNKSSSYSSNSSSLSDDHDNSKAEGTLYYMAPELFTNDFPVGKSIDYWAIGIVIFELFTFKSPFEAETQEKTKQNIIDYNINWEPIHSEEVTKNYKNYIDCTIDLIKKFIFFNPAQRWGDKNFKQIQNHEFFKGFDWVNIKKIKNSAVLSHLKKVVEKNNKKIKELNKAKGEKNNGDLICEVDLNYDESNLKFSQRIDNLQKRNNELIKMKFKKKEIKIEDDDENFKRSLFFDLQ